MFILYKCGSKKIDNLFCTSIVFLIIITYILYICTFINITVFLIVVIIMISIVYIYKCKNNINCM